MCAGGETLLAERIIEIVHGLLKSNHFISIVTNMTVAKRIKEMVADAELLGNLFFKCSLHYIELKKRNLVEEFFNNVRTVRKAGASFSIEIVGSDEAESYIDEIKEVCLKYVGAPPHVTIPRHDNDYSLMSRHTLDTFVEIWNVFDSDLLRFKAMTWGQKRREYCYAGKYSFTLNGSNGNFAKCYHQGVSQNIFEDSSKPIDFESVACNCNISHCFNSHLFLGMGLIKEIRGITYADMRDRVDKNTGDHWLNNTFRELFSLRFTDYEEK